VGCYITSECRVPTKSLSLSLSLCLSLSLSLLFVQRSRGLSSGLFFFKSPGSKAHVCFKNDNLFCLSFVFLLYMLDTGFYRWITPILVDGLTESCNSPRTNECSKCGKNHWVLFKAKDWKKKKKCNPTLCLLGILLILYVKNVNLLSIWLCNFYF